MIKFISIIILVILYITLIDCTFSFSSNGRGYVGGQAEGEKFSGPRRRSVLRSVGQSSRHYDPGNNHKFSSESTKSGISSRHSGQVSARSARSNRLKEDRFGYKGDEDPVLQNYKKYEQDDEITASKPVARRSPKGAQGHSKGSPISPVSPSNPSSIRSRSALDYGPKNEIDKPDKVEKRNLPRNYFGLDDADKDLLDQELLDYYSAIEQDKKYSRNKASGSRGGKGSRTTMNRRKGIRSLSSLEARKLRAEEPDEHDYWLGGKYLHEEGPVPLYYTSRNTPNDYYDTIREPHRPRPLPIRGHPGRRNSPVHK